MLEDKDKESLGKKRGGGVAFISPPFILIACSCFVLSLIIIHPSWLFPRGNLGYGMKNRIYPQCGFHHKPSNMKSKMLGVPLLLDREARQTRTISGSPLVNTVRGCRMALLPGTKHSVSAAPRDIVYNSATCVVTHFGFNGTKQRNTHFKESGTFIFISCRFLLFP